MAHTHVRGAFGFAGSGTTLEVSLHASAHPALGDCVCVAVQFSNGSGGGGASIVSVEDDNGNAYTVTPASPTNYTAFGQLFLAYLLSAPANAHRTITVTFSGAITSARVWADQFTPEVPLAFGDEAEIAQTTIGNPITSPTVPVPAPNALLYAACLTDGAITGANSPWSVSGGGINGGHTAIYHLGASANTAVDYGHSGSFPVIGIGLSLVPDVDLPEIESITPDEFADGASITIAGANFEAAQGDGAVRLSPIDDPDGETSTQVTVYTGGTLGTNPTTASSFTLPATAQADDVILLCFTSRDHTAGTAQPTVTDDDTGGNTWQQKTFSTDRKQQIWWKRCTSGSASKTVSVAGAVGSLSGVWGAFRDVYAGGDPIADLASETNTSGDESHAELTVSHAGSYFIFAIFNTANDNTASSLSAATFGALDGLLNHLSTGGNDCATAVAGKANVAASGSGAITWSQTNGATYTCALALRPRTPAGAAVAQTVTAWADDAITITVVQDTLALGAAYAFVLTDGGAVNASGSSVTITASGGGDFKAAWARGSNVVLGM